LTEAKKQRTKPKKKKAKQLAAADIDALREKAEKKHEDQKKVEDWKREQELRKDYEKQKPELAPWIGWEEYRAAKANENRIKAVGIIGAIMRGEKRTEIRKHWKISSNKLNAILNSELVDDLLAYSLGHVYSFQDACIKAILWKLEHDHDGYLAMNLLDKMGTFIRSSKLVQTAGAKESDGKEGNAEDVIGVLFSKGDSLQARQIREKLQELVIHALKSQESE